METGVKMAKGKRMQEKTTILMKQKIIAILIIITLLVMLAIEASLSFFSDIVITTTNKVLGAVQVEVSNVEIEQYDDVYAPFTSYVQDWTLRKCKYIQMDGH